MNQINGMPIHYLHGVDDENDNFLVGLLGLDDNQDENERKIYEHLVKTRDSVVANPMQVKSIQNPADMLKMLDYAIKYYYTPKRQEALDILEREEEKLIKSGAIVSGVDDNGQPLEGFFSKIKDGVKKFTRTVGDRTKAAIITAVPASKKAFDVTKALVNKPKSSSKSTDNKTTTSSKTDTQTTKQTTSSTNSQTKMPDTMNNPEQGTMAKIFTPKNIAIGVIVIGGAYLTYRALSKDKPKPVAYSQPALNGVRGKKKKSAKKPAAKKALSPAKKKVAPRKKAAKIKRVIVR